MKKPDKKDIDLLLQKKKVSHYKELCAKILESYRKSVEYSVFIYKISMILCGCAFLLGVAFGLLLMGVGA